MYQKLLFTTVSTMVLMNATPSLAENIDLSGKPISTPTLDYLHEQGVTMPESNNIYPESAYSITKVEDEESPYSFELITKNETGDFVSERYLIDLKKLGTSQNIEWELVDQAGVDTVEITLPNETKYFKYTYNKPSDYTEVTGNENRIENPTTNIENKVFKDISGVTVATSDPSGYLYLGGSVLANVDNNSSNIVINSDFIGNHQDTSAIKEHITEALGGAILNYANENQTAKIDEINGNFIGNYLDFGSGANTGGAIYNSANAEIGSISGNFIKNYTSGVHTVDGGAIYNGGLISNISGNFIDNYAKAGSGSDHPVARGGAIYNGSNNGNFDNAPNAQIKNITANFIGNYAEAKGLASYAYGGAIYNNVMIDNIIGDFIDNSTSAPEGDEGGAIHNGGNINKITGDFIGNYTNSLNSNGGAISNRGKIDEISGNFINNHAYGRYISGGAISNDDATINNITGNFIANYVESYSFYSLGGAISNESGTIKNITGNFINNYAKTNKVMASGGAIFNGIEFSSSNKDHIINNISGNFIENYVQAKNASDAKGGAISNTSYLGESIIHNITGDFRDNYAKSENGYALGGAIYNNGEITLTNSNFMNNYVEGNEGSNGGAIYSTKDITLTVQDDVSSEFTDNYVLIKGTEATEDTPAVEDRKIPNAIYMASADSALNLNAYTNGHMQFNDEINGVDGYQIKINGDESGKVVFNNNIRHADITLDNTNLIVTDAVYLGDHDNLTINSGKLTINSGEMVLHKLDDRQLHFEEFSIPSGQLTVTSLTVDLENKKSGMILTDNVVGDKNDGKIEVKSMYLTSDGELGSTPVLFVSNNISEEVTTEIKETVAPVYKYKVDYDTDTGDFIFTRLAKEEKDPEIYNPGIFSGDIFKLAGLNMQQRTAENVFDTDRNYEYCFGRVWAIPYYSDDTIGYSGFYDVDSENYGVIAGIDTRAFGDYDDWNSVYTLFGAFNDGREKYQGIKVDTKSWLIGLKASVFKEGFYTDALVNYARHDSDHKTRFGTDNVDSTGYGAAIKSGYKYEFESPMLLDTSAMLSWQYIEGGSFTSKSGAKISPDDYSRLTLTPQVKLSYKMDQVKPYALVRYNFVLDQEGSSTVNNIALPTIESKDYVEYGLGLETTDAFPHNGYAHVLRHDGGREGWSVTAGYKYNF